MKNHFANQVISVRSLQKSPAGELHSERLYTQKGRRKKPYRGTGLADKLVRRWVRATAVGAAELANRHETSSRRKRSGGLRDLGKNMFKASRKASKRFRLLPI